MNTEATAPSSVPRLVILGGLPATGKTTVARRVAALGAAMVRVDTVETALARAAGVHGARVLEVELVCTDVDLYRRRLESRVQDLPGPENPSWEQVTGREHEGWHRDHPELDTAVNSAEQAARRILEVC